MVTTIKMLFSFLLQFSLRHRVVVRMFGEFLFGGEDLVHICGAVSVGQGLPDGLRLVLAVLDGGQLHVLRLAGGLPLGELGLREGRIRDELSSEDSLVFAVPQFEADVGPGVHH